MKTNPLRYCLLLVLAMVGLVAVCQATTTVNYQDGDNGKVIRMTANGDAYTGGAATITGLRINSTGGAKSYHIRKGTAATGNILWTGYHAGTAGTTGTLESAIPWKVGREGINITTDNTTATSFTLELYTRP